MKADVVVVGAGAAGSVISRRLAEAGADVLLLEAGEHAASPLAGLLDVGPGSRVVSRHRARLGQRELDLPRGRTLGGSGAVNGGYCMPARPADLAAWGPEWPHRYAVGLGRAAERLRPGLAPMGEVAARVAAAFPGRVSAVAQARRGGRRVTAFDAWDPVGAGVRVRTGVRVARLRWAGGVVGGRCDGVVLAAPRSGPDRHADPHHDNDPYPDPHHEPHHDNDDDNAEEIAAREVILCAGTIGTTAVLRASGLGPATGHPLGERVQEHPEVLLELPAGFGHEPAGGRAGPLRRGARHEDTPSLDGLPPLLTHVVRIEVPGSGPDPGAGGTGWPEVELRPYSVPMHHVIPGAAPMPPRLGISLMNPVGHGRIAHDGTVWLPHDPRDTDALAGAAEIARDRLGLAGPAVPSTSQHLCGAARMGEVVDEAGRVLGVAGLRVADASVLPTLPRCGPYYTVLAVAEVLAGEMIAAGPW